MKHKLYAKIAKQLYTSLKEYVDKFERTKTFKKIIKKNISKIGILTHSNFEQIDQNLNTI